MLYEFNNIKGGIAWLSVYAYEIEPFLCEYVEMTTFELHPKNDGRTTICQLFAFSFVHACTRTTYERKGFLFSREKKHINQQLTLTHMHACMHACSLFHCSLDIPYITIHFLLFLLHPLPYPAYKQPRDGDTYPYTALLFFCCPH